MFKFVLQLRNGPSSSRHCTAPSLRQKLSAVVLDIQKADYFEGVIKKKKKTKRKRKKRKRKEKREERRRLVKLCIINSSG